MDEFTWAWMYQNWYKDQEDSIKTYKDFALYIGSFVNPDMAAKAAKEDNHDFSSSKEDFEEATKVVRKAGDFSENIKRSPHRRRRKVIKQNLDK